MTSTTENILYGETGPRAYHSSRGYRLEKLLQSVKEPQEHARVSHSAEDVPDDFFSLLKEGVPRDDRVPELMQTMIIWVEGSSSLSDGSERDKALQILAWGPAVVFDDSPDFDVEAYTRLASKYLAWKLSYVSLDCDHIQERLQSALEQLDAQPITLPELVQSRRRIIHSADSKGMSHYVNRDKPYQTMCGKPIKRNGQKIKWSNVSRLDKKDPLSLSLEAECSNCEYSVTCGEKKPRIAALTESEQNQRLTAQIRKEVPQRLVETLADRERVHPIEIQQRLERLIWRAAVESLLLQEPLSEAQIDQLSELQPDDSIPSSLRVSV